MAYRNKEYLPGDVTRDNDEEELLPERLYTSSCGGEVKEWDPSDGSLKQMTIIKVGIYVNYWLTVNTITWKNSVIIKVRD